MKIWIFITITVIGVLLTRMSDKSKGFKNIIISIIASIAISIMASYIYDIIINVPSGPVFFPNEPEENTEATKELSSETSVRETEIMSNESSEVAVVSPYEDVSSSLSFSGSISSENEVDKYKFTTGNAGTYCFSTERSSGGSVKIRISGENGKSIDSDYDTLIIDLEAEKTYILSIEYNNGACDYKGSIGKPSPIIDITGQKTISGNIYYEGQKDKYLFTTSSNGIYRFDTDLSSGGEVRIRISGENGNSIDSDLNGLTIELEERKNYILSVEYTNTPCDYAISIGVPVTVTDISNISSFSGEITYQDQKNIYTFTAPTDGTYHYESNLSSGAEIRIRISGENYVSLDSGINRLSIDLEAGKKYILSIEYRNSPCKYTINVGIPIAITDVSGTATIWGNIFYIDQKDKYIYTAPITGTYIFESILTEEGEIRIRISGENGKSLAYATNYLTVELEAGKTYILSAEYRDVFCPYQINIGLQQ